MKAKAVALIGSVVIFGASIGQETVGTFDGTWAGTCGPQVEYELHGLIGRAKVFGKIAKDNPCTSGFKSITVTSTTPEQINFKINGAEALQGCPDILISLKRVDVTHLTGTRKVEASERACSLTRQ